MQHVNSPHNAIAQKSHKKSRINMTNAALDSADNGREMKEGAKRERGEGRERELTFSVMSARQPPDRSDHRYQNIKYSRDGE